MDILEIIKRRASVRKYKDKPIPKEVLDKIIEAGIWGPSLIGYQPWHFVIITKRSTISKIANTLDDKAKSAGVGGNVVLSSAARTIAGAPVVVCLYRTNTFVEMAGRFRKMHVENAKVAEISSLAACAQNMILTADNIGVASCWLDMPLLCEKQINDMLNVHYKLIAVLTFGYPDQEGKRTKRNRNEDCLTFIAD